MANQIVTVDVTVTAAPSPSTFQQTGALISQGGTTAAANSLTLLTQESDLTSILAASKALTSLSWSGGLVTGTTTSPHGWGNGDIVKATIAGAAPTGYNGTFSITITGASTFTYSASNPGSSPASPAGNVTLQAVAEIQQMATTWFAQPGNLSVNVLELGEGTAAAGVTALGTWITANPGEVYAYLTPREFDGATGFTALLAEYETPVSQQYFFVTTTTGTYTDYVAAMKDVWAEIEAPSLPTTEFSTAASMFDFVSAKPSSTNKLAPLAFRYQYDVTPYPSAGNSALLASLKTANTNIVGTGAEGGLSNDIVFWGTLKDGNDASWWYSVDWWQLNIKRNLAAAIIAGSQPGPNPLYYNQLGINRLQANVAQTMGQAVSSGMALGSVIQTQLPINDFLNNVNLGVYDGQIAINAEPFTVYLTENPNDFAAETYNGITVFGSPNRGFRQILVYVNVTDFAA